MQQLKIRQLDIPMIYDHVIACDFVLAPYCVFHLHVCDGGKAQRHGHTEQSQLWG